MLLQGHRLFRDTANLLIVVAEKILAMPTTSGFSLRSATSGMMNSMSLRQTQSLGGAENTAKTDSDNRYKAILLFMRIFSRLLGGASDFANIGVFALFGDKIV